MFYCRCFFFLFFISPPDIRAASTDQCETLPRDGKFSFVTHVPKFGVLQKKIGAKTCKIGVDFRQLQTSIANISGVDRHIQNRKPNVSTAIPPAFDEKSHVNFGPPTTELTRLMFTKPKFKFSGRPYFGP